MRKLYKIC